MLIILIGGTSHGSILKLDDLVSLADQILEAKTEYESLKHQLEAIKIDASKTVDSLLCIQKYGLIGQGNKKPHKHLAQELKIYDRLNRELYNARSGNWNCCVYRNHCKDVTATTQTFNGLSFIEEIYHKNILPILELRRFSTEVQMFVKNPSLTLYDYITQERYQKTILPINKITKIILKIARGLEYLHSNKILNRSLTSKHIYLKYNKRGKTFQIYLCPFFMAKDDLLWNVKETNLSFYENTTILAPEIREKNISTDVEYSSDIWSFGIILYELLTLQNAYEDEIIKNISDLEEKKEILKQPPILPIHFQTTRKRIQNDQLNNSTNASSNVKKTDNHDDDDFNSICDDEIDYSIYQNVIDLYRACTNIDHNQRPQISEIVKSLQNNINIKEITGLAFSRGPGSIKDWVEMNRTYTQLTGIDNCPIIEKTEKFIIEKPIDENQSNPCFFQYLYKSFPFYAKHLSTIPHENYAGMSIVGEIILVSLEIDGQFFGDQWHFKALIRNAHEDLRIVIACENPKDRLKTFKQHPNLIDFNLQLLKDPSVKDCFIDFERKHLEPKTYKFGIIYRKAKQTIDDEMYSNEHGSPDFDHFLLFLGDKITLKGWNHFRGGLDTAKDTTGTHSIYTNFNDFEIIFHTSTLLPYDPGNPQQLHRKRHIGNDVIVIIFQDEGADAFTPANFASHFNHVFCVVQVDHKEPIYDENSSVQKNHHSKNHHHSKQNQKNQIPISEKVYYK